LIIAAELNRQLLACGGGGVIPFTHPHPNSKEKTMFGKNKDKENAGPIVNSEENPVGSGDENIPGDTTPEAPEEPISLEAQVEVLGNQLSILEGRFNRLVEAVDKSKSVRGI